MPEHLIERKNQELVLVVRNLIDAYERDTAHEYAILHVHINTKNTSVSLLNSGLRLGANAGAGGNNSAAFGVDGKLVFWLLIAYKNNLPRRIQIPTLSATT